MVGSMKKIYFTISIVLLFTLVGCGVEVTEDAPDPLEAFYASISSDYPFDITGALTQFGTNTDLGFRTSGSTAELAAAEYIYNEMVAIGLENVVMDELIAD